MNRNVNVFIGVILCALLCGCFVWLFSVSEEDTWKPNAIYDQLHATSYSASYTNVTYSVSSTGGLALTMSPSSALRRRAVSSYAGAYSGVATMPLTSNLSPLTYGAAPGAGLYTTSSAEIKSFGGGGNGGATTGGGMRGGSAASSVSMGAGVGSMSIASPIAYSTARRSDMTIGAGDDLAQMMAENPVMAMANATNVGMGNTFFGGYSVMDYSFADYGQYTTSFGGNGRSNVSGRRNSDDIWESWFAWFHTWWTAQGGASGDVSITKEDLYKAWLAYCADWNSTMGGDYPVSFEEWEECFKVNAGYGYGGNNYYWAPVGDILPLLIFALLYVLLMAVKYIKPLTIFNKKNN
jgi:hypothetical protein